MLQQLQLTAFEVFGYNGHVHQTISFTSSQELKTQREDMYPQDFIKQQAC